MGPPVAEGKKRIKITVDPLIYNAFKLLCKKRGYGHPSNVLEAFMRSCLRNEFMIRLVLHLEVKTNG